MISAQATDAYGNVSTVVTDSVTVAETLPTLAISPVNGNNIINHAEAAAGVTISGASTGLASGATFNVTLTDGTFSKTYTATVGTGGAWTAAIPSSDATALANGTATLSVQATDAYGNTSTAVGDSVLVAETAPVVTASESVSGLTNKTSDTISETATTTARATITGVEVYDNGATRGRLLQLDHPDMELQQVGSGGRGECFLDPDHRQRWQYDDDDLGPGQHSHAGANGERVRERVGFDDPDLGRDHRDRHGGTGCRRFDRLDGRLRWDDRIGSATLLNGTYSYTASNLALGAHDFSLVTTDAAGNATTTSLAPVTVISGKRRRRSPPANPCPALSI